MKEYPYLERLAASIIDAVLISIISMIIAIPVIIIGMIPIFASTGSLVFNAYNGYDLGVVAGPSLLSVLVALFIILLGLLVLVLVNIYWYVNRPARNDGQTYGKGLMKLKITRSDGQKLTRSTLFWRYVVMTFLFQFIGPFVYITIFFDDENRSIYDILVGTKVVRATL